MEPIYPITFLSTTNLEETITFYRDILKFPISLDQNNCIVFRIGKYGYWGFCKKDVLPIAKPSSVCLTVVVKTRKEVDDFHAYLLNQGVKCTRVPEYTSQYKIYNGFYSDPMGYTVEIQAFDDDGQPIGHELF